ncbi:hypothetical protein [Moorella sp. ACPs]|uniref:hypothetical protein n=1 Tax=Neomoorella carbonis TaxID=3062783 RepID=UPI003253D4B3
MAMSEKEIIEGARKEIAAASEGVEPKIAEFGYYHLAQRTDNLSLRIDNLSQRIDGLKDSLEGKIATLDQRIDNLRQEMKGKRKIAPTYHRGGGKNKLNYAYGKQEAKFPTKAGVDPGHLYPGGPGWVIFQRGK